jgi:phosphate transport system permease protein
MKIHLGIGDRRFERTVLVLSLAPFILLLLLFFFLTQLSFPAMKELGFSFFTSTEWNPAKLKFGALPFLHGTLLTSLFALLMAVPVSVSTALFLTELAPRKLAVAVGFFVELLATIPSVIFGLWGLTVVAPGIRVNIQPFLSEYFGWTGLFSGMPYGVGVFSASLILAIMVIPTITSLCTEVFRAVPVANREAALAIGATSSEAIQMSVLKASTAGIFAAVLLGWSRALGETMAVTMLIGNRNEIASSLFAPAQTIASLIANEYAEASSPVHIGALAYLGLTLFLISFGVNFFSKKIIQRTIRS